MMKHMSHKELSQSFLSLVTTGDVRKAYDLYVHPDFTHHNQYHTADREALMQGMIGNEENFPHKEFVIKKMLEEGDTVMTYSSLKLGSTMPDMAVVHILRFQDDKIIEMWDCAMQLQADSPNENGVF